MITATKLPITADEFARLPEGEGKLELADGRVVEMAPAANRHSVVQARIGVRLQRYLDGRGGVPGGEALPELGCRLDDRTVLVPDVAWVHPARLGRSLDAGETFIEGAPELAVEIVSLEDSLAALARKAQRYLDHGTRVVWIVDPLRRRATLHRADGSTTVVPDGGVIPGEDLFPGFELALAELFS